MSKIWLLFTRKVNVTGVSLSKKIFCLLPEIHSTFTLAGLVAALEGPLSKIRLCMVVRERSILYWAE